MRRYLTLVVVAVTGIHGLAEEQKWVTIKGRFVWDAAKGPVPKRVPLKADKDADVAAKDDDFNSEEWIVDQKNGGIKNVVVWITPDPTAPAEVAALKKAQVENKSFRFATFRAADVHPALAKPAKDSVEIDQPCCRFIPHFVLAREGQDIIIKNSASVPHNAHWISSENGEFNPIIPSGKQHVVKGLKAERTSINISCDIHKWMKAYVRVFDHPYYALTDSSGAFEIKDAPVLDGKLRFFAFHEEAGQHGGPKGRLGTVVQVKPGAKDLGDIKLDFELKKPE